MPCDIRCPHCKELLYCFVAVRVLPEMPVPPAFVEMPEMDLAVPAASVCTSQTVAAAAPAVEEDQQTADDAEDEEEEAPNSPKAAEAPTPAAEMAKGPALLLTPKIRPSPTVAAAAPAPAVEEDQQTVEDAESDEEEAKNSPKAAWPWKLLGPALLAQPPPDAKMAALAALAALLPTPKKMPSSATQALGSASSGASSASSGGASSASSGGPKGSKGKGLPFPVAAGLQPLPLPVAAGADSSDDEEPSIHVVADDSGNEWQEGEFEQHEHEHREDQDGEQCPPWKRAKTGLE
jgi:hypothetical protein